MILHQASIDVKKCLEGAVSAGLLFLRFVFSADNILLPDRYRSQEQYGCGQRAGPQLAAFKRLLYQF